MGHWPRLAHQIDDFAAYKEADLSCVNHCKPNCLYQLHFDRNIPKCSRQTGESFASTGLRRGYVAVRGVREHLSLIRTARRAPGCGKFKGLNSVPMWGVSSLTMSFSRRAAVRVDKHEIHCRVPEREARNHIPPQTGIIDAVLARLTNTGW